MEYGDAVSIACDGSCDEEQSVDGDECEKNMIDISMKK